LSDTAQKIRELQLVPFTITFGGEELTFQLLTPQAMHLSKAGIPIACFSHRRPVMERLKSQQEHFQELAKDEKKSNEFLRKLLGFCMVAPRFYDGPLATCPDDAVCLELIEGIAGDIFDKILELAGYAEAGDAAKWAESFREDPMRGPGDVGGQAPPEAPVGADPGQPG